MRSSRAPARPGRRPGRHAGPVMAKPHDPVPLEGDQHPVAGVAGAGQRLPPGGGAPRLGLGRREGIASAGTRSPYTLGQVRSCTAAIASASSVQATRTETSAPGGSCGILSAIARRRSLGSSAWSSATSASSGLKISAIAYGNWLTHGSQVEEDAALACVRAALDEGITTFDTADVYADTKAERCSARRWRASGARAWRSSPRSTGRPARRAQRPRAVAQAHHGVDRRLAAAARHRLRRPLPGAPLRLRDAARGDDGGLRRRRALRQGALHRRLGVAGRARSAPAHALARELHIPLVSNQPQYNMLWRVIEAEVVPTCEELGIGQIVWSPIAQGVLTGKYKPGEQPPAGSRATDDKGGADMIGRWLRRRRARAGAAAAADRRRGRAEPGPARRRLGAAEPQRLRGDHRREPARAGHRERQGRRRRARRRAAEEDRRGASATSSTATRRSTRRRRRATSELRPDSSTTAPPVESTSPSTTAGHQPSRTPSPSSATPTAAGTNVWATISGAVVDGTAARCMPSEYSQNATQAERRHRERGDDDQRCRRGVPTPRTEMAEPA